MSIKHGIPCAHSPSRCFLLPSDHAMETCLPSQNSANGKMADRTPDPIPIPGPPGLPLVGNALAIEAELPLRTFQAFAEEYGKLENLNACTPQFCGPPLTYWDARRHLPLEPAFRDHDRRRKTLSPRLVVSLNCADETGRALKHLSMSFAMTKGSGNQLLQHSPRSEMVCTTGCSQHAKRRPTGGLPTES